MNSLPPHAQLMSILMGRVTSAAVSALASLGVPGHLASGPKTTEELAHLAGARPDLLGRLMRTTESVGVLARTEDGRWQQTSLSEPLCPGASPCLLDFATMIIDDLHNSGFGTLDETVRTGQPAPERVLGMPYFEFLSKNPADSEHFNRAMTEFSIVDSPLVVDAYDFTGINSLTDIAGGRGLLLSAILERYPAMQGTLYEIPHVLEGLADDLNATVAPRMQLTGGNMFENVPPGADAYIMKHIIHDWPDDMCIRLLSNCRAGIREGGKLLVVDAVVPADDSFSPAKLMDLAMMLLVGGKERTEEEFRALFAASGWRLNRIVPTPSPMAIIEGVPA